MNRTTRMIVSYLFIITLFIPQSFATVAETTNYDNATLYYNEACSMCSIYVKEELIPTLKDLGIKNIAMMDYVNEKQNRLELNEFNKKNNIPPKMQGHFLVIIGDKIMLGGHVPKEIVVDLLTKGYDFDKILVLQDEMENAKSYFAWGFKGEPKEYSLNTSIKEYIDWFSKNKDSLKEPVLSYDSSWNFGTMLPLIITSGFIDGINPCAFAVLLFFISFLFTIRKTRANIWAMGITYIIAIFIAYFMIGLGLIQAIVFTGTPHLMAEIGSYLLIGLGIIVILNQLFPNKININLGIPTFSKEYFKKWMYKATLPSAFIAGFIVGLCTFPCSGGIYVAVIGLLAAKTTYTQGLVYLVIYNIMFVMPLVIILAAASNKRTAEKISKLERSESKTIHLLSGAVMIALGIIMLLFFV